MKVIFGDLDPGETPIDDCSGLKIRGIVTRSQLNIVEAENIRKVLVKYFGGPLTREMAPFDFTWAKQLHAEMFGEVWEWAGQFRTSNLNLGYPWTQIQTRLYSLLEDLKFWEMSQLELIEQATRLHHGAVRIHPFLNGNGRWGRMLTNIWLVLHGSPDIAWPDQTSGNESPIRKEYIAAIKECDEGNFEPLIKMHRQYLRQD